MWALALPTDSKTPTRMGIEPTTFWFDQRCSTDWATRPTFVLNVTLHCTCTYSLTCNWHLHFPRPAPVWSCSSVGGAVVITKVVGSIRILVGVSLCPCVVPIPSVGLTLTLSMGRKLALHIQFVWKESKLSFINKIALQNKKSKTYAFLIGSFIHWLNIRVMLRRHDAPPAKQLDSRISPLFILRKNSSIINCRGSLALGGNTSKSIYL